MVYVVLWCFLDVGKFILSLSCDFDIVMVMENGVGYENELFEEVNVLDESEVM